MTEPGQPNRFFARGGAWVMVQAVLMSLVIALAVRFRGAWQGVPSAVMGGACLLAGCYFGIAGAWVLGRNLTPYPQPRAGAALVEHGVYSLVRHPLYTSVMLMSLGWALLWQSAASLGAALVLIPFFHTKARREERWLRREFPAYQAYESRVPRFIPGIRDLAAMVRRPGSRTDSKASRHP